MRRLRGFFRKLRRAWDYACFGWGNGDYDWGYLLALLHFKLARMEKAMTGPNAYSQQESKTLKSLRIATRLADRLAKDQVYDEPINKLIAHVPAQSELEPMKKPDAKLYRKVCVLAENHRNRDLRWLTGILNKYILRWWD
jgi:hypothetical protein